MLSFDKTLDSLFSNSCIEGDRPLEAASVQLNCYSKIGWGKDEEIPIFCIVSVN